MKIAFAVFLFVHALAHGVGALTVSGIVKDENNPSDPSFLLTGFDAAHWVFKLMAVIWLIPLAGFVVAGIGVIQEADWALTAIIASTVLSTILSLIWVKAAPFGLVANLIIIAVLLIPWANDRMVPPIDA
ncbi:MAG: hypothetical protein QNJ77_13610 [Acidimicrobiia bacterium]|nr:hypothetical protein [Acidimicrobiia bacterium]